MNEKMPINEADSLSAEDMEDIEEAIKNSFPELKPVDLEAAINRVLLFQKMGATLEDSLKKFSEEHEESKKTIEEVSKKFAA